MGGAVFEATGHDGRRVVVQVCGDRRIKACVACGRLATRLCDFKVRYEGTSRNGHAWHRDGTCSAPVCERHTTSLPGDKDACPEHRQVCLDACARHGLVVPELRQERLA